MNKLKGNRIRTWWLNGDLFGRWPCEFCGRKHFWWSWLHRMEIVDFRDRPRDWAPVCWRCR